MIKRLWLLFALFIVYGTLSPFQFTFDRQGARNRFSRVSLNPLRSPATGNRESIPDLVQNVLLFIPFGVLGAAAAGRSAGSAARVVALAACLSLAIEALQLFTPNRTGSFGDVVFDTAGAGLGLALAHRLSAWSARQRRWLRGADAVVYPAVVLGLVVCLAAWEPFDVTLDVGMLAAKIRALQRDLWQFAGIGDEGLGFVQYAVLAAAVGAWLDRRAVRLAPILAAGIGAAVACALEASQIVIGSRMPGMEDALVRCAGAAAGAGSWAVAGRRAQAAALWLTWAAGATSGVMIQAAGRFPQAPDFRGFRWFAFMSRREHTAFELLSHRLELLLAFFLIGFCWSRASRWSPRAIIAASMLFSGLFATLLQVWTGSELQIAQRLIDVCLSVLGAAAGSWAGTAGAVRFQQWTAAQSDV